MVSAPAWEQRKVSEIFKLTRGQVLPVSKTTEKPRGLSQYPVYSSQTKNDGLMGYYSEYLFDTAITWTTDGANAGTVKYREGKFYSTNVNGVLISENGYANNAVAEIINQVAWKYVSKVGNPKLMNNVMGEILIKIPSSTHEQDRISLFLLCLDSLISLHQRKLDNVKMLKKSLLQKLFPKDGEKIPELRFPGFTDDWEQRKLESVLLVSTEKNIRNEYSRNEVLSVSREAGTVNQIEYQGRSFAGEDLSGYKVVHEGELIYTKSPLRGAPYGIFQVATIRGILSPLYAVYKSSNLALASFVATYLKNDSVATKYLAPLVTKGAKNTINVTDEGALKGKILIPQVAEQQRIYSLFVKIDGLLSLHQRKLDHLKELKKGLLQQMFV